jgi:hypothetical protein
VAGLLGSVAALAGCSRAAEPARSGSAATAIEQAMAVERTRCGSGVDLAAIAPVLNGTAVRSVEPFYANDPSGSETGQVPMMLGAGAQQASGALLRIHAMPSITAEWLDRSLECYSAERVLGRIPTSGQPDDPFWLPGRIVAIDVRSAGDGYTVMLRGTTPDDAREILDRANAFAIRSRPMTSSAY